MGGRTLSLECTAPPFGTGSASRNAQQGRNARLRGQLDNRRNTVLFATAPNNPETLTNEVQTLENKHPPPVLQESLETFLHERSVTLGLTAVPRGCRLQGKPGVDAPGWGGGRWALGKAGTARGIFWMRTHPEPWGCGWLFPTGADGVLTAQGGEAHGGLAEATGLLHGTWPQQAPQPPSNHPEGWAGLSQKRVYREVK